MDNKEYVIQRGQRAKELLANDTLVEALDDMTQATFATFMSTDSNEAEAREKVWAIGQAIGLITTKLQGYVDSGRIEKENLKYEEES